MVAYNTFETVYRISIFDQKEAWWFAIFGAAMTFVIIAGIKRLRMREAGCRKGSRWIYRWPPWSEIALGALGLVLSSVGLAVVTVRMATALHAYRSRTYRVSEGTVTVLHRQPHSGHDRGDIVRIGDDELEINYYRHTPGYDRTIAHGGALREGVYARVFHYKGTILRIDIRRANSEPEIPK